jgi:MOSC domain-containing protein YiiM
MAELVGIYIAETKGAEPRALARGHAVPGRGLEGDRYFLGEGTFSKAHEPDRELTLIEMESIEALARDYGVPLDAGRSRRNLVTRGVALGHLVGKEFLVGEVRLRGIRFCEPCGHLEKLTKPGVEKGLVHRGGLRAQILTEGVLQTGDPIQVLDDAVA